MIATAKVLAGLDAPGQADLRRAVSTAYYGMFHALCDLCASALHGPAGPDRAERAWRQTYRAVNHNTANTACRQVNDAEFDFPDAIKAFARTFATLQAQRHLADYDPAAEFWIEDVRVEIVKAQAAIEALDGADASDMSAFAALVFFRQRD